MATQKQIEANRRNAQKSTGPKTHAGRSRSRLNALKHGLARAQPSPEPAPPLVTPLARAIAGAGVTDPAALAQAEQIVAESLTLLQVRLERARLLSGPAFAALSAPPERKTNEVLPPAHPEGIEMAADDTLTDAFTHEAPLGEEGLPHPDALLQALLRLERYERQALARRSRALTRLEARLARLSASRLATADAT